MGFFRKQLLSVIEWNDPNNDIIVYRYPVPERSEIMNSSTLVVRESQVALFMHKGEIADVFGPGTYKLATENIPFLTKMLSLSTGGESRIKAEVYFINTKRFMGLKWGTKNPIMMRDVDFGSIRIRGFGSYSIKVEDATKFMKECFGTNAIFRVSAIEEHYKSSLIQMLTEAIAESGISALDLAANYKELSKLVEKLAKEEFAPLGLKVSQFVIENLSLPEEVEKTLDERTKMGVIGYKMGTYAQLKAANAIEDIAKNPNSGGGLAGLGVGLGAGTNVGEMFAGSMATVRDTVEEKGRACINCGAKISPKVKFCPECGSSQVKKCAKCGETIAKGTKFCGNCGTKVEEAKAESKAKVCANCGASLKARTKFCPECGKGV